MPLKLIITVIIYLVKTNNFFCIVEPHVNLTLNTIYRTCLCLGILHDQIARNKQLTERTKSILTFYFSTVEATSMLLMLLATNCDQIDRAPFAEHYNRLLLLSFQ
jgi:hypothetical protein